MFTKEDFKAKYESYSDEELYEVLRNADQYSQEARDALTEVLEKKGGNEGLIQRLEAKIVVEKEKARIAGEALKFGTEGVDAAFMKNTTSSQILSKAEVDDIIEKHVAIAEAVVEDKKVNADTIIKSLVGCGLASILGGAFACLQFLYLGATSILMIAGTALICYGTVKLVTKKSFNNTAVLLSSFAAFILAWLWAMLAYSIFGYLG